MCGIIGYKGKKQPKEILINGLKNLEYRGYDSAGIAINTDTGIKITKAEGKIKIVSWWCPLTEKKGNKNHANKSVSYRYAMGLLRKISEI